MSWRTQDDYSIGGFCLKLKLTDSPGIAGGFYWINPTKGRNLFCAPFSHFILAVLQYKEQINPAAAAYHILFSYISF